ncbi:MAG: methyltransferase domain-containing protein [Thermodesulfobacteriota bacterium]
MTDNYQEVSKRWVEELKSTGYEYHVSKAEDCRQLQLSRVWKRIFQETQLHKSGKLKILEVGCGGGLQLAKLAAMGCDCVGIDVSEEVLARSERYFAEIRKVCGVTMNIRTMAGDFYEISRTELGDGFDLVFNFGVIEHILDDSARLRFLEKKYELTKDGGYIVSMVPNGVHPLREKMKRLNLGGYNIPEIDYNRNLMEREFRMIGAREIKILPHNLFYYLLMEKNNLAFDIGIKLFYYGFQLIPQAILPKSFCFEHAGSLIGIGRK